MLDLRNRIERSLDGLSVSMALTLPSGERIGPASPHLRLRIDDAKDLMALATGRLGAVAEAFVEGRACVEGTMRDLMSVTADLLPRAANGVVAPWWMRLFQGAASHLRHSRERDAAQIRFHYDVSDDFYALWLDPRRVYSCAYFPSASASLAEAQEAKLDLVCRKLALKPGERFLDVGAGWGGLLLWAAEHYGVDATGITLSQNQFAHVERLIAEKGLGDRVRMRLLDYRDLDESVPYDKISSIGMFEHVGSAHMRGYFDKLRRLLRPGGLLMNHGITAGGVDSADVGGGLSDFIDRYIFPGGELLHIGRVLTDASAVGLEPVDVENLRPHYAKTLWAWSDALETHLAEAERVLAVGSDTARAKKIIRAYRLYLAGCAMAFEQGWVALHQILATRPSDETWSGELRGARSDYPFRRDYIYEEPAPAATKAPVEA